MGKKIEIPEKIYRKFEERASDKGLDSAEEYVNYVLEQIYEKVQDEKSGQDTYTDEQEEKVKNRLEGLGYLD